MDAMCSRHSPAGQRINTFNLLDLPPELVLKVIDHAVFDETGIMNFALTSTRFFYMIQELVKKRFPDHIRGPSFMFQDIEAMQKTIDSSVSPVNTAWKIDCTYNDPCLKEFRKPRRQTPLVRLIEHYLPVNLGGHYVDDISMEKTYHTIEWMLDKGADVNMDSHPRWYQGSFVSATAITGHHDPPPSKPPLHYLLSQLLIRGIDHNRINAVVKLVSLFCNRGAVIPAEIDHYTRDNWRESLPGLIDVPSGMFSVAFLARSPPSILESFLTQFSRRNVNWASRSHEKPKQLDGWWDGGRPYLDHGWSSPVSIVEVTFNNFFHPDRYYQGDVETLDEKVKLLIKFKAIDEKEQKAFGQLVGAAWEIDALRKQAVGLNLEQHGMVCWYKLSRFITTLVEPGSSGKEKWQEKWDGEDAEGYRFHAFSPWGRERDIVFHRIKQTGREIFRKVFSQHELTYYADDTIQTTIFRNNPTKLQLVRDLETFKEARLNDIIYAEEQTSRGFRGISQNCDTEFLAKCTRNPTAWNKSYGQNNEI